jgi:hypothetical protein
MIVPPSAGGVVGTVVGGAGDVVGVVGVVTGGSASAGGAAVIGAVHADSASAPIPKAATALARRTDVKR